jgi:hypothetical protein
MDLHLPRPPPNSDNLLFYIYMKKPFSMPEEKKKTDKFHPKLVARKYSYRTKLLKGVYIQPFPAKNRNKGLQTKHSSQK